MARASNSGVGIASRTAAESEFGLVVLSEFGLVLVSDFDFASEFVVVSSGFDSCAEAIAQTIEASKTSNERPI